MNSSSFFSRVRFGWKDDNTCESATVNTPVDDPSVDTGSSGSSVTETPDSSQDTPPTGSGESSKFFLVNNVCIDSADGAVMGGKSYATHLECCKNIQDFDLKKECCYAVGELTAAEQLKCLLEEVAEEAEQFYFVDGACYSNSNGVMDGQLYETKEECCEQIESVQGRHSCSWDLVSGDGAPAPSPDAGENAVKGPTNSAAHLARGTFLFAAFVCFQFM